MNKPKILVVDDDRDILILLKKRLELEGYEVFPVSEGEEVIRLVKLHSFSLIVLDIVMPSMNGLDICKAIRDLVSAPILLLSAKDREIDKVLGLELGADDYITKPFSMDELTARIKSHLRRELRTAKPAASNQKIFQFDDITINGETYEVIIGGELIHLSGKELEILLYMVRNKNLVLSREQIYNAVWGYEDNGDINTVTVYLKNIRKKIDPDHKMIKTIWGIGYKFVV
ncbi:response regulator transcription factor [Paenibacillus sp. P46E]|uniref:response regulator transcription factor n=1 Tax=Paenibacillus sp. P46E TaxID=1349436 RepID=UPI00093CD590|nr:response regulator transcription factor [Paenibacillus sp. P46E]OKP98765.1 DNA-binding response regulator [Paenibacillus sp. P46E]